MRARAHALTTLEMVAEWEAAHGPLPAVEVEELAARPVARPLGLCSARRRKMVDGSMSWVLCARDERHTGRCEFTRTEP